MLTETRNFDWGRSGGDRCLCEKGDRIFSNRQVNR